MIKNLFFSKIHVHITRKLVTVRINIKEIQVDPVLHIFPDTRKIAAIGFDEITENTASELGLRTVYLFEDSDKDLCKGSLMEAFFRYAIAVILKGQWTIRPPTVHLEIGSDIADYFRGYAPPLLHFLFQRSGARRTNYSKTFGDIQ